MVGHLRAARIMGILLVVIVTVVGSAALLWFLARPEPAKPQAGPPTTGSAEVDRANAVPAATTPVKIAPKTYMDVVRATYPDFPTTQPLPIPVDLREGARIVLNDLVYLDPVGHLWITRDDAEPTPAVLKAAAKEQTHVVRERVVFVHRWPDERGVWQPQLVVAKPSGGFEIVSLAGRQDLGEAHVYDWDRAFSWNDAIVVPTLGGASIIRPDRRPIEIHHAFYPEAPDAKSLAPTQLLLDWRGLLAWMPWENGMTGSPGAARFINEKWVRLDPSSGWPEKLLHLVPLLDGGVVQLIVDDDGGVSVALAILDPAKVDEARIAALVARLSNPAPQERDAAFAELTRYGQGIWPVLEKLAPEQGPEAKLRIDQLLEAKIQPKLGALTLQPGAARVVTRSRGGAALLWAQGGVAIPTLDGDEHDEIIAPAWLAIVPGRSIQLAPQALVHDLDPATSRIEIVRGEIIVSDDVQGPRWWLSNHFSEPLLKKSELPFNEIVGPDARGRWLFRKSSADGQTLILDPTIPDPAPRLPVWQFPVTAGTVGWTSDDWPAIKSGGAWVLGETDWRPLDEKKETLTSDWTPPATATTTFPSTGPTTAESGPPVLVDPDGTRWYDGREELRVVKPDGTRINWPLPTTAVGTAEEVWLIRAGDERLFLFNEPGRVLRIKPTPGAADPFALEATFTRRIPSVDRYTRVWRDPAGRIIVAHEGQVLTILFPSGTIPPAIARKIPASELKNSEE